MGSLIEGQSHEERYIIIQPTFSKQAFKIFEHCVIERKNSNLLQLGIEPGRLLDLQANTLPHHCKSKLLPQGIRSLLYT